MKIAMYGGTFNPIHRGHMQAAQAVVSALSLDKLLLMPAGIPPHKVLPEGSATPAQRLEMCQIAANTMDNVEVSSIELERTGPSYTVDTLRELRARYPEAQLWLVMGTDMVLSFDHWRQPEDIARLCRLAVVARDDADRARIREKAAFLEEELGAGIDIIENPALPMSSTQVRESLDEGLLHPAVLEYIRQHKLYLPSVESLRAEVERRVGSTAHGELHSHNRQTQQDQAGDVDQNEDGTAVLAGDIGKFPDVADADGTAGTQQDEAQTAS